MGGSYVVPRNVKGESRLLVIFTIKSFIATLAFGLSGLGLWFLIQILAGFKSGIVATLVVTGVFAIIGYLLATVKIPDIPAMGVLRKAGGENIGAMLIRWMTFRKKKKIYMYNYKRELKNKGEV